MYDQAFLLKDNDQRTCGQGFQKHLKMELENTKQGLNVHASSSKFCRSNNFSSMAELTFGQGPRGGRGAGGEATPLPQIILPKLHFFKINSEITLYILFSKIMIVNAYC